MTKPAGNLASAHRGYIYQDVVTAYFLAQCLTNQSGVITVDKKLYSQDRFDDLTVKDKYGYVRRQFKRSSNKNRSLKKTDFTQDNYGLRLDCLIRTYTQAGNNPADEYRLCATWISPTDKDITPFLTEVKAISSFEEYHTRIYQLCAEKLWPQGQDPIWSPLKNAKDFTRDDFINFSKRFLIELECPEGSNDFKNPLVLENLIMDLLIKRIGIGHYPNQHLSAMHVAEELAWRSYSARTTSESIKVTDIERHLRLRNDYGRVVQQFPMLKEIYVSRNSYLQELKSTALREEKTILVGTPGSGKSWSLDNLAETLKEEGHIVARHYCYLEPGDEQVQQRVTTNVLFANLIAELVDSAPELREKNLYLYSAGLEELESILPHAVSTSPTGHVFLIIDGVDHISRVVSEGRSLSLDEVDIIEKLAVLSCPKGIHLLIGSQPGSHLEPLKENSKTIEIPPWHSEDISELAVKLGIVSKIHHSGFIDIDKEFMQELTLHCEGNPLYVTYLCNDLMNTLNSQVAIDPLTFLKNAPILGGNIAVYYEHLLQTSDNSGGVIANLLGTLDFGVTEEEIKEILPSISYQIPNALMHLKPILKQVTSQGGIRIYHESFRRFILDNLKKRNILLAIIIDPIIGWLRSRGFWKDPKAYRFLLPLLRRADRNNEILELVGFNFASKSLANGHPQKAIDSNLDIAITVAAENLDWASLARYAHVRRSVYTCFEENFDAEEYGQTYAKLFGYKALAEQLLFDGTPTMNREKGLILCSICDDAGFVAPWQEYLNLPVSVDQGQYNSDIRPLVAQFHGKLRLEPQKQTFSKLIKYLDKNSNVSKDYLQQIFRRYACFAGKKLTEKLLRRIKIPNEVRNIFELEFAKILTEQGDIYSAISIATNIINRKCTAHIAYELIGIGLDISFLRDKYIDPGTDKLALYTTPPDEHDEHIAREWVASVGIIANIAPEKLSQLKNYINFEGWYGLWLHFVVALSHAEVIKNSNAPMAASIILEAIKELASDTAPFKGDPRACDLYNLWAIIHDTIERALCLLDTEEQWIEAIKLLTKISQGTTTYLQNSPGGPLTPETLCKIIIPYLEIPKLQKHIIELLRTQVQGAKKHGEYYSIHATHEMLLAQALYTIGEKENAITQWDKATQYLCGYGVRKDISLFDLVECAPVLARYDPLTTRTKLSQIQSLIEAVLDHTDGKETKHLPNSWFEALCKTDLVGSLDVLSRSLIMSGGRYHWVLERAVRDVANNCIRSGNPILLAFLSTIQPFVEDGQSIEQRLEVLKEAKSQEKSLGLELLRILSAKVQGDDKTFNNKAYAKLSEFASEEGICITPARKVVGEDETNSQTQFSKQELETKDICSDLAILANNPSPLQVIAWIRKQRSYISREDDLSQFINTLVKYVDNLIKINNEWDAMRVVRYTARHFHFSSEALSLAELAQQLECKGHTRLAAATWALAYARSSSGYGWLVLGGSICNTWIKNGLTLSTSDTLQTLAIEIEYLLHEGATSGVARHLVEMCAECISIEDGFAAWEATFEVLQHRLPLAKQEGPLTFAKYSSVEIRSYTVDEALFYLLTTLISHPELKRKTAAMAGCAEIIKSYPTITIYGITRALSQDTPVSSTLTILQLLEEFEQQPFLITKNIEGILKNYVDSDHFGFRWLAYLLLKRIAKEPIILLSGNPQPSLELPLTLRDKEILLFFDWNNRIENIDRLWSTFSNQLFGLFNHYFLKNEKQQKRAQSRHELFRNPIQKLFPKNALYWENEIFELTFHKALCGISEYFLLERIYKFGIETFILNQVLPKVSLHIGIWNSRTVRPPIPLPRDITDTIEPIKAILSEDEYNGWYRCAYYEEELILAESGLRDIVEKLTATGGVIFSTLTQSGEKGFLPFGIGKATSWLETRRHTNPVLLSSFNGPLIGFEFFKDFHGMKPLLMLHPTVAERCGLDVGDRPGQLLLKDSNGKVAVLYRCWNVRALGANNDGEPYQLVGCDLIVRPDVFTKIVNLSNLPPSYVSTVIRKAVET